MDKKLLLIARYYITYVVFLLILKNINYIFFVSFDQLVEYFIVFIPIAYIVVKYLVYYDLEKRKFLKKELIWYLVIGFTLFNLIFSMPYVYTGFILLFLIICKDRKTSDLDTINKNICDYYKNKKL